LKGHRRRRGDGWELRVYAGKDPATGKPRVVTEAFHGGARAADARLRILVEEVERGERGGSARTVGRLLKDWLALTERLGRSPTTLREYRRLVDKAIPARMKAMPVSKLTAADLHNMYAGMTASVAQVHAIMRAALHQGEKWGLVSRNVAKLASPPRKRPQMRTAPPMDAVAAMIRKADADDVQLAMLVALAAVTGARRGELCELRWSDVDFEAATLTISRAVVVVSGKTIIKDTKTSAARVLALDPPARAMLRRHWAHAVKLAVDGSADEPTTDSPILSYDGVHGMNPDTASHRVRDLATECGVDTHLHALRHFAATQMLSGGVDVRTVAGRLGHADTSTTLRVYAHVLPERDREAAAILGQVLAQQ
jgi:integrase